MPTARPPVPRPVTGDVCWNRWPFASFGLPRAREIWDSDDAPARSRVVVAVIDDGFDLSHPALKDNLWQMPDQPGVHGWNFVDDDANPSPAAETPVSSHGTMVAGIIGGRPDVAGSFAGVAPNARLMLLRWHSNQPRHAQGNPANLAAALRFAIRHGARIVNLSAGIHTAGKTPEGLADLRRAFKLAETRGVLVVVAVLNMPENMDTATYWLPGVYPFDNIIHVTGLCRELRLLGAWGEKSVDIAAPAEDIIGPTAGGGYRSGSATSFATPLVTGALALVWGLLPELRADQVRHLILRHAKSLTNRDSVAGAPGPLTGKGPALPICPPRPHELWGHQFPAMPEGRLDLGFLEEACERYWHSGLRPFPGGVSDGAQE